jgi:hypothetical protein
MGILEARKKAILEDGRITVEEAKSLVEAAQKDGFTPKERDDLRTFFIRHEFELEPEARQYVEEALGVVARVLREQIEHDGKVTEEEVRFLVDEVRRNGISQAERQELQRLLLSPTATMTAAVRQILEDALGIGVRQVARAAPFRDEAELAPVRLATKLVQAANGKPVLREVALGGVQPDPTFLKETAPSLKKFVAEGKSSLTAAEASLLAQGLAGGAAYKLGTDEPFVAGDRVALTVHYPDGERQETSALVVSAGTSPQVMFVNRRGFLQLVRQDSKSRDQLTLTRIIAGRAG